MRSATAPTFLGFVAWGIAGAGIMLSLLTVLSIGLFVLPVVALLVLGLLASRRTRNESAVGLVCGFGLLALYVAYLNRDGPGDVCTGRSASGDCVSSTTEWSPWPWLIAGLALIAGAASGFLWLKRAAGRHCVQV